MRAAAWWGAVAGLGTLTRVAAAQEPPLATLVQPLAIPWEVCKQRARAALGREGYAGILESGNGWAGRARGTSVSVVCLPRNLESVVVIVTAGRQPVRESTRLFNWLRDLPKPPRAPESVEGNANSGWSATAIGLTAGVGTRLNFWCPPRGGPGVVWGDSVYAAASSICTAAVHAGTLSLEAGGNAIIELLPGRASYTGSNRNGIATFPRDSSLASFTVVRRSP